MPATNVSVLQALLKDRRLPADGGTLPDRCFVVATAATGEGDGAHVNLPRPAH